MCKWPGYWLLSGNKYQGDCSKYIQKKMARHVFRQYPVHVCFITQSCPGKNNTVFAHCHSWWFVYTFVCLQLGACVCVLIAQSCPALCDPIDCSPPDSSFRGIHQARILEWVALPSSRGPSWPRDWTWVSLIVGRLSQQGSLIHGLFQTLEHFEG